MPQKAPARASSLELLRILCMLFIIGDHFAGQSGLAVYDTLPHALFFAALTGGSRTGCSIFVMIGAWFLAERPFKTKRVLHLWGALWGYTVAVTLLCKFAFGVEVSLGALRWAVFPVSTRQLWFLSDYLVLLLAAPLLNAALQGLPRRAMRALLAVFGVLLVGYATLFAQAGVFDNDLWVFLFEYLLIGYLKRYPDAWAVRFLQKPGAAFACSFLLWGALTAVRSLALWQGAPEVALRYLEYARSGLASAPNMLCALAAFWWFKGLRMPAGRLINGAASATLGVYILHQVPVFHDFLWNGIFHAAAHAAAPVGYSVFVVLATFAAGTAIELLRAGLIAAPLERTRWFTALCRRGDALINGGTAGK